ncbi:MAG TPA: hypothetical protein DCQ31_13635 [Bacteroidales bacterium]|nr:hypothetical protein [Bacteroidales bacterium]
MKTRLAILAFSLFFSGLATIFAQERVYLYFRIENEKRIPLSGIKISVTEDPGGKESYAFSNSSGMAEFFVPRGKLYKVTANNIEQTSVQAPDEGLSYVNRTIVLPGMLADVTMLPDTIVQKLPYNAKKTTTEVLCKFNLVTLNNVRLPNVSMSLYSVRNRKVYKAFSDDQGIVRLLVEPGDYSVSVEQLRDYMNYTVQFTEEMGFTKILRFELTNVKETMNNDTITQQLPEYPKPSSARVMLGITVRDRQERLLPNENVFLNVIETGKVYKSVTDRYGKVNFLLPKGFRYQLNLTYERDLYVYDWPRIQSMHTTRSDVAYMGTENIRTFYTTTKRDSKGFLTEFMQVPIKPAKNNSKKVTKSYGYDLEFSSQSPVCTPLVTETNIFSGGGFYSSEFYCFDKAGAFKWAVNLGENGPSAAMFEGGIVLVISQSCTLYAIDAETGVLAWSKWLGPNIYHSPSVANGKVYVVYPNDLRSHNTRSPNAYVAACFDLKTGNVVWQNSIDSEVLAAPVIAKNGVFYTTHSGMLYHFNATDGTLITSANAKAICPPTINGNSLYVSIRGITNESRLIARYDIKDFSKAPFIYSNFKGKAYFGASTDMGAHQLMSANDASILNISNQNVTVIGGRLVCFDATTGAEKWAHKFETETGEGIALASAAMPAYAGGHIITAGRLGKVLIHNVATGKLIKEFITNQALNFQPVVNDGKIYVSGADGRLVCINTFDKKLTGWSGMGGNNGRNAAIEN